MKKIFVVGVLLSALILLACQPFAGSERANTDMKHAPDTEQLAGAMDLLGVWAIEKIGERDALENSNVRIQFSAEGKINGHASCNRFFGEYGLSGNQLVIQPLGSTRMMCLPSLMEQEQRLLELLPGAVRVTVENNRLVMRDLGGALVIQASKESAEN